MHSSRVLALALVVAVSLSGACGTGNRLDTLGDGPGGGQYLAIIQQIDSGIWPLVDSRLDPRDADNNALDLYVPNQDVVPSFHVQNATLISTGDPTYDTTADGVPDFIVITMRTLAAQAAANVTAIGPSSGNSTWDSSDYTPLLSMTAAELLQQPSVDAGSYAFVNPDVFYKVGGCAILPLGGTLDKSMEIWLPISTATDGSLTLYKWVDGTQLGHSASADIGTGTGAWVRINATLEQPSGAFAVKFSVDSFGQYAVVSDSVTGAATGNTAPVIASHAYDQATKTLTVAVTDADGDDVTVTVTEPTGLTADVTSRVVTGGNGNAVFVWDGTDGTTGETTISANDGHNTAVTATQTITVGPVNASPVIVSHVYDQPSKTLTVAVTDAENADVTVTVTEPTGLTADDNSKVVTGGNGNAVFIWSGTDGTSGDTTITASDGVSTPATATQAIAVGPVANAAPVIVSHEYVEGTATLTVVVSDADTEDVVVTVTEPAGLTADVTTRTVTGGDGNAIFVWTGSGSGDTTITADDNVNDPVTTTQTINIGANDAPVIGAVTYLDGVLTVPVTDPENDAVTVSVTQPAGFFVHQASVSIDPAPGSAVFTWTAEDIVLGATGETTITATDGINTPVTTTQALTLAALGGSYNADTLYAVPLVTTTTVGTEVTIVVLTGAPAHELAFASSIGFTVENAGSYVADSFNIGAPGGARTDTDGFWALMGPPVPGNGAYLDLGDAIIPGAAKDIGGGLHRYDFGVVTQGPFTPDATLPSGAAALCNFKISFSAAGTYHLGFQLNDGSFDVTYYADQTGGNVFHWGALDSTATITVN